MASLGVGLPFSFPASLAPATETRGVKHLDVPQNTGCPPQEACPVLLLDSR